MNTLPFDCSRCEPIETRSQCLTCLRYTKLPGQTFGPRTATTAWHPSDCPYTHVVQARLQTEAMVLETKAREQGFNLEIANQPLKPLAMGNTHAQVMVWPLRKMAG